MVFWRISNFTDLAGRGAELSSGRWHTAAEGKRIVYLAEHPAVALIENLANLRGDPRFFQTHFQLLKISSRSKSLPDELNSRQLARIDAEDIATTRSLGDAWLTGRKSALLRVPSIPSPESWNYLLNPLHPEASVLKLDWARAITYDKRLFHLVRAKA
jgi:RES domain-containing protein